jgi:Zn-finger nucleic acid-binding protein
MSLQCPNCGANVDQDCVRCDYCQAILTVTACPSCFGPVFKGMNYCPSCGESVERQAFSNDQPMNCPRCAINLVPVDLAGTRIDECSQCGGIWLGPAAFQRICEEREKQERALAVHTSVSASDRVAMDQSKRFYIPCPVCGELMNQKNYAGFSGVVIDLCKQHGIWFDRLELQRIINFIKDGGLHRARENELATIKQEQDRLLDLKREQSLEPLMSERLSVSDLGNPDSLIEAIINIGRKIINL